jgi:hypothetical protein
MDRSPRSVDSTPSGALRNLDISPVRANHSSPPPVEEDETSRISAVVKKEILMKFELSLLEDEINKFRALGRNHANLVGLVRKIEREKMERKGFGFGRHVGLEGPSVVSKSMKKRIRQKKAMEKAAEEQRPKPSEKNVDGTKLKRPRAKSPSSQ